MKKISIALIVILIMGISIIFYQDLNKTGNIKADYFNISYGKNYYKGMDKAEKKTTEMLIHDYNKIKFTGTTNQEISYDKAICITFVYHGQISGQITIDDNGICLIEGKTEHYHIDTESTIYKDGIKAYEELKDKYKS